MPCQGTHGGVGVDETKVHEGGGGHVTKGGDHEDELSPANEDGEKKSCSEFDLGDFLVRKKLPGELGLLNLNGGVALGPPLLDEEGDVEDKEADELSEEHGEGLVDRLLKVNADVLRDLLGAHIAFTGHIIALEGLHVLKKEKERERMLDELGLGLG